MSQTDSKVLQMFWFKSASVSTYTYIIYTVDQNPKHVIYVDES